MEKDKLYEHRSLKLSTWEEFKVNEIKPSEDYSSLLFLGHKFLLPTEYTQLEAWHLQVLRVPGQVSLSHFSVYPNAYYVSHTYFFFLTETSAAASLGSLLCTFSSSFLPTALIPT